MNDVSSSISTLNGDLICIVVRNLTAYETRELIRTSSSMVKLFGINSGLLAIVERRRQDSLGWTSLIERVTIALELADKQDSKKLDGLTDQFLQKMAKTIFFINQLALLRKDQLLRIHLRYLSPVNGSKKIVMQFTEREIAFYLFGANQKLVKKVPYAILISIVKKLWQSSN